MLPGFRLVCATVVLAISFVVFGLGAAALLRASHDQFSNLPLAQAPREPLPVRDAEQRQATLALLRVEMMAGQAADAPRAPADVAESAVVVPDAVVAPPSAAAPEPVAAVKSDDSWAHDAPTASEPSPSVKLATVGDASERASPEQAVRAESKVEATAKIEATAKVEAIAEDKATAASSDGAGCVPAAAPPPSQPLAMLVEQASPHVDAARPVPRPHVRKATAQRAHHARHRHARLRRHRLVMQAQAQAQAQAAFALQQQQASPFFGLPVTRTR